MYNNSNELVLFTFATVERTEQLLRMLVESAWGTQWLWYHRSPCVYHCWLACGLPSACSRAVPKCRCLRRRVAAGLEFGFRKGKVYAAWVDSSLIVRLYFLYHK